MGSKSIPTYCFVLVVVRKGHRFLVVQERKHEQRWYLPAGRVERGEGLIEAARRETLEEAGIPISVDGIIRVEHTPYQDYTRLRIIFLAHPIDDTPPKCEPDQESLGAGWYSISELKALGNHRGTFFIHLFEHVQNGGFVAPIDFITAEEKLFF